jgi:hypothetical protein
MCACVLAGVREREYVLGGRGGESAWMPTEFTAQVDRGECALACEHRAQL